MAIILAGTGPERLESARRERFGGKDQWITCPSWRRGLQSSSEDPQLSRSGCDGRLLAVEQTVSIWFAQCCLRRFMAAS